MTLEAHIRVEPKEIILSVEDKDMVIYGLNVISEILANHEMKEDVQDYIPVEIQWR